MAQEETKTIEEGVGFFDFSEMMQEHTPEQEQERQLEIPEEKKPEAEPEEEQEQEEIQKEEQIETPEPEKEKQVKVESTNYSNLAKKYIELGTWKDATIETEDGEVTLSEIEDLDEQTFLEIVQAQDAQRNEEIDQKFINKEDLDDISLKIIEISKNGGDIKDVLKAKETYIDNLNTYDLDNEQHQELLVRQKYKLKNPELTDKQVDALINTHKEDLDLDTVATGFADDLKASYHKMLDDRKQEATQLKQKEQEERKGLRKSLKETLSGYGLKDHALRPLIDSVTKEGEDGNLLIDSQFAELKKNPDELAEFLLWKNNREDYKKLISEKQTSKEKKDTLIKLNLLKGKTTPAKKDKGASGKDNVADELVKRMNFL